MDEGRLGAVRRQQDHHRKSTIVMNDLINFQQKVYTCYLKREQQNTESKLKAQEVYVKRSIVRNSYLLQCLDARKQKIAEIAPEKQILGRYGGRPIHAYSRDVDACMSWMHPRLRRLRRVERAKEDGKKLGAIMDFTTIPTKMEAILHKTPVKNAESDTTESNSKPSPTSTKFHTTTTIRNQSFGLPNIFMNNIYNRQQEKYTVDKSKSTERIPEVVFRSTEEETSFAQIKRESYTTRENEASDDEGDERSTEVKEINDVVGSSSNIKSRSTETGHSTVNQKQIRMPDGDGNDSNGGERSKVATAESPSLLDRRPTLILPPIKSTKEMKVQGFDHL